MAVTVSVYNLFKRGQIDGSHPINLGVDQLKISLHAASYTPNLATHEFYGDLTNEVAAGAGYTTGGEILTTPVVATGTGFAYLSGDPTTWAALTKTFRYAVLRATTGSQPLIMLIDFGADQSPSGIDFTLQWAVVGSGGVLKFT